MQKKSNRQIRKLLKSEKYCYDFVVKAHLVSWAFGIILLFGLIGGESDQSFEKWEGLKELYELVCKATLPERKLRFQSIKDFYKEWELSLKNCKNRSN